MADPHPFERSLMTLYKLDAERLRRLGVFLLAHATVDLHVIAAISSDEVKRRGGAGQLGLDDLRAITDDAAQRTFGAHLSAAKDRGLVNSGAEAIATELNRARIAFLHWQRDRFSLPVYKGQDVMTEEGLRACLDDVFQFTLAVPLRLLA